MPGPTMDQSGPVRTSTAGAWSLSLPWTVSKDRAFGTVQVDAISKAETVYRSGSC